MTAAAPDEPVILSNTEQESMVRMIQAAVQIRHLAQFRVWTQGQLQSLLPHAVMVLMRFDAGSALQRIECFNSKALDAGAIAQLCDADAGLAVRAARHWSAAGQGQPAMTGRTPHLHTGLMGGFGTELRAQGYGNMLLHGSGPVAGGANVFAFFGLPEGPRPQHAYILQLMLPYLHLAFQRVGEVVAADFPAHSLKPIARPLSLREREILAWVRDGKSNSEVGCLLGISALTVKNHLQRIYRALGVNNRTHALSRSLSLGLLEGLAA